MVKLFIELRKHEKRVIADVVCAAGSTECHKTLVSTYSKVQEKSDDVNETCLRFALLPTFSCVNEEKNIVGAPCDRN